MFNFMNEKYHTDNLSKSDKKILAYINKYPQKVELFTINQLALEVKTSVASVQRLCQKLGYSGFREFKFELSKNLKELYKKDQNSSNYYLSKISNIVSNISIDDKNSNILVKELTNGYPNILLGSYYSGLPAYYLYDGLIDLGYSADCATNTTDGEHLLNTVLDETTIVLFSIHGLLEKYRNYWRVLLDYKRNSTFLITMNKESKLQDYFSHTIFLPGISLANQFPIDPQTIPMLYIEMLLNKIYNLKN